MEKMSNEKDIALSSEYEYGFHDEDVSVYKTQKGLNEETVRIELNAQVTNVDEESITYVKEGVEHKITEADTLIFAVGYAPKKVEVEAENVHYIGDCEKVGTLKDAITNAHEIAKNI